MYTTLYILYRYCVCVVLFIPVKSTVCPARRTPPPPPPPPPPTASAFSFHECARTRNTASCLRRTGAWCAFAFPSLVWPAYR